LRYRRKRACKSDMAMPGLTMAPCGLPYSALWAALRPALFCPCPILPCGLPCGLPYFVPALFWAQWVLWTQWSRADVEVTGRTYFSLRVRGFGKGMVAERKLVRSAQSRIQNRAQNRDQNAAYILYRALSRALFRTLFGCPIFPLWAALFCPCPILGPHGPNGCYGPNGRGQMSK
jgi:hypothetical protein